jgi:WD40 repeat protein
VAGYDAFISYSHAADGTFAPSLQQGLQRLARRWNQRRALHVFRDETGLAVTPHLWESITDALDTAGWFVLLASPESAQSEWVGKEIEHWLAKPDGGPERILIVVTDGVCRWEGTDFSADSTAVHQHLRHVFSEEPLYQDMSWARTDDHLDLHNPRFRTDVARVAAPMHGVDQDELVGEDIRQFKLARRLRRAAFIGLATLTAAAVVATVIAFRQKDQADTNAAQSRSRELAATARSTMDDDPTLAALLAVDANYPNGATSPIGLQDATATLGTTLRNRLWASSIRVGAQIAAPAAYIAAVSDGRIATIDSTNCCDRLVWWNPATGRRTASPMSATAEHALLARYGTSHTSSSAVYTAAPAVGPQGLTDPLTVDRTTGHLIGWNAGTHEFVVERPDHTVVASLPAPADVRPVSVVALPSGRVVALDDDGHLIGWSVTGGGAATPVPYEVPSPNTIRSVAPLDGNRLLVASATVPDARPTPVACSLTCRDDEIVSSDTPPFVYVGSEITNPRFDVVDVSGAHPPTEASGAAVTVPGSFVVAPPSGPHHYVAARTIQTDGSGDADVDVWDFGNAGAARLVAEIPTLSPTDLRWVDGSRLAVASARGVEQYRVNVPRIRTTPAAGMAVAADGRTTAVLSDSGTATRLLVLGHGARGAATHSAPPDPAGVPVSGTVAVSADGSLVASVHARTVPDAEACASTGALCPATLAVRVVRLPSGRAVSYRHGGKDPAADATAVGFDPSDRYVAFGTGVVVPTTAATATVGSQETRIHGSVTIVRSDDARVVRRIPTTNFVPSTITWTPDGRELLLSGENDANQWNVRVLDAATGDLRELTPPQDCSSDHCEAIAVSRDGRWVATTAAHGTVRIWARNGGRTDPTPVVSFVAGPSTPTGVAFDRDGTRIVTSGPDTTAIWDVTRPASPRRVEVVSALPALASILQPGTGDFTSVAPNGSAPPTPWGLAAFAPDGRSLTIAGPSGIVTLADFDPGLACSLASPSDLAAAARVLGAPSACTRVAALRRRLPAASRAPRPQG